ncbi:hypothetical protein B0H10DRAFT_2233202 [Mycena sp. CBHHK59/15]|nr:hypothetical protein B0H10DRAFT_2233202 [Mycena sp. CBHHK59/15]
MPTVFSKTVWLSVQFQQHLYPTLSELEVQKRHVDAFDKMVTIAPDRVDVLRKFYKDNTQWAWLMTKFRSASASARQGDTNGLKHKLLYLPSDSATGIVPHIGESEVKLDRGLNHPMLHDALLPWKLHLKIHACTVAEDGDDGDLTPEADAALKALMHGCRTTDGKPALTAKRYPSCFYADDTYDPEAPEVRLLRSLFLVRVARHIWTSPGSALHGAENMKKVCHARVHGQFTMTPEMIGYVCCQARTMLSTSDWATKDGPYNYDKLFKSIVKLFEDPTDSWVIETLDWYQKGVFGCGTGPASDAEASDDDESEMAGILARRTARRSAASNSSE